MESVYAESRRHGDQFIEGKGGVANRANMKPGVQGRYRTYQRLGFGMAAS